MTLRACSQCRRHFAAEPACPFCGAAAPPPVARSLVAGHISRAAVFAGLAGCYTSNPPPQQYGPPPPPPPVEQQQTQQQFATPPGDPPPGDPPPAVGSSRIQGVITDNQTGMPMPHVLVQLQSTSAPPRVARSAQTDPNGRYQFVDLPAGTYVLRFGHGHPRMGGPPQQTVQLADRDVKVVDFQLATAPQTNLPTPYGAPPVRRRVV